MTCAEAIHHIMVQLKIAYPDEVFSRASEMGTWTNDTIWQHLMSLIVNLRPAYEHWLGTKNRCLFVHENGRYELYDPQIHGKWEKGRRTYGKKAEKSEKAVRFKDVPVTKDDILRAMADPRITTFQWRTVYILYENREYPVKGLISLTTGIPVADFMTQQAEPPLRKLGFEVVRL